MIGQILDGRYYIVQELGAGGFGQTYLAKNQRIPGNPTCVVKQLKPLYTSPEQLEFAHQLFQREAETLAKLGSHDQIPRLTDYFTEGKEFYLVQDYIEGQPLEAELGSGQRWDERQVLHLLQELLPVLVFVHDQGVIHRDLKPANVIRRRQDNKLVLIDFGAIKQIQGNAGAAGTVMTGTRIGTMGYMSPEQGRGKPQVSSDLYALGMMGIQALTGKLPSQLEEDPDTEELIWQNLVRVSPGLAQVLTQMVRYSIRDRYKSAVEVLQAIQPLVTSPPSGGIPEGSNRFGQTVAATQVDQTVAKTQMRPSDPQGSVMSSTQGSLDEVLELTLEWVEAGQTKQRVLRPNQPSRSPGVIRIGRDPAQCDIVVTDLSVSGLHVEVFFDPQQRFMVRNLRQKNPPLVDGIPLVTGDQKLVSGTRVMLGQTMFWVALVEMRQYLAGVVPPVDIPTPIPSQRQPVAKTVHSPSSPPSSMGRQPSVYSHQKDTSTTLESKKKPTAIRDEPKDVVVSERKRISPFLGIVIIFLLVSASGLWILSTSNKSNNSTTAQNTTSSQSLTTYPQDSCEDSPLNHQYKIFISDNGNNLNNVRTRYCKDAFLNKEKGKIQVARFQDKENAKKLMSLLSNNGFDASIDTIY